MSKMGIATEVQELMATDLETVRHNQCVRDVLNKMTGGRISALPVLDQHGACVGIVSTVDLVRILISTEQILESDYPHFDDCLWVVDLIQQRLGSDPVSTIMAEVVTKVSPDTSMHDAACIMLNNRVHHLPVINAAGRLVGMISSSDFVRLTANSKNA